VIAWLRLTDGLQTMEQLPPLVDEPIAVPTRFGAAMWKTPGTFLSMEQHSGILRSTS